MSKENKSKSIKIKKNKRPKIGVLKPLEPINSMAAGIDIGSTSHFVAVPAECDQENVREFTSFTSDLHNLANWLKKCGVTTVAMESTGVYWIPLYELLESENFEVKLVDARKAKNVSGRKSDVLDCQWLQQLHSYGLLQGAFRPDKLICSLRAYNRQRAMLIAELAKQIQHMQKALSQMNLQLHNVISDITGTTGIKIIRSILDGIRDPEILAKYRDPHCKRSIDTIEKSLIGNYKDEHIFALKQAVELYDIYSQKISDCDIEIEKTLVIINQDGITQVNSQSNSESLTKKNCTTKRKSKNAPNFDLGDYLKNLIRVDLTNIPGVNITTALTIISEVGIDMSKWKNSKSFAAWLGLCPGTKISGGKVLSSATQKVKNRAAAALRIAASTLYRSQTALGAFLRRLKTRLGPMKAITATAHKLAIIIYNMIKNSVEFKDTGFDYYEQQYKERVIKNLKTRAKVLGFDIVAIEQASNTAVI